MARTCKRNFSREDNYFHYLLVSVMLLVGDLRIGKFEDKTNKTYGNKLPLFLDTLRTIKDKIHLKL